MRKEGRRSLRPEPEGVALEAHRIQTAPERRRWMQELANRRALVALFAGDQMLTVNVASLGADHLVLDAGPEDGRPEYRTVLVTPRSVGVAFVDDHKLQFVAERPIPMRVGNDRQLRLSIPEWVWRIGGRRGHRVKLPDDVSVWARLPWPEGEHVNYRAQDLSVVGVGLHFPEGTPLPPVGTRWAVSRLQVVAGEAASLVPCTLTVRRVAKGLNGRPTKIGCAIDDVPHPSARTLQRLVMDVEVAAVAALPAPG